MPEKLLVEPRKHVPFWVRLGANVAESKTKKKMQLPLVLAWYKRAAFSSGILESLASQGEGKANGRLLQLIRIQISMQNGCHFCMDMNMNNHEKNNITKQELDGMQNDSVSSIETFSQTEIVALTYARDLTETPPNIDDSILKELQSSFNERELIIISTTIAQVNYWTRLIRGLGIPVATPK
ncbi:MAG: carboxymuconolactone decarboxylase family protein [Oscillospiraceae bacterium]|nr:carboxymuconolactone decarboxylase family protein [Oscillospiraceae bacterium]